MFKYGTFEMRAKLPSGRGAWSAFWLLRYAPFSWPQDGEIGDYHGFFFFNFQRKISTFFDFDRYHGKCWI